MITRQVPAVNRAADILELFLFEDLELDVPRMSELLGIPRTSAHEQVATLVARDYLAPGSAAHTFRLGVKLFELGGAFSARLDLTREGGEVARKLSQDSGETVHVAVLDNAEVLYVVKEDSSYAIRLVSSVGKRLPAHCTAVGKVLLAYSDKAYLDKHYPADKPSLEAMTSFSVDSRQDLLIQLNDVKISGLAHEAKESNEDASCIAAPVYGHDGHILAAISIAAPSYRMEAGLERYEQLVRKAAAALSDRLGHRDSSRPSANRHGQEIPSNHSAATR